MPCACSAAASVTTRTAAVLGEDPGARRDRALRGLDELVGLRRRGLRGRCRSCSRGAMKMLGRSLRRPAAGPADPPRRGGEVGWGGRRRSAETRTSRPCATASTPRTRSSRAPCNPADPQIRLDTGGSRMIAYSIAQLGACRARRRQGRTMNAYSDPLPDEGLWCVEASAGTGKTTSEHPRGPLGGGARGRSHQPNCSSSPSRSPRPRSCAHGSVRGSPRSGTCSAASGRVG